MRIHHDQLPTRIAGSLLGAGFVLIGAYAAFGAGDEVGAYARERAFWFGISAMLAGVGALGASWLVGRLDNIWCAPPRRGWFRASAERDAPAGGPRRRAPGRGD